MRKLLMVATAAAFLIPAAANAQAIISSGNVRLGINQTGELNIDDGAPHPGAFTNIVGLRSTTTGHEATADGCTCEGWGAAVVGGSTVFRNTAVGSSAVGSSSMVTDYAGPGTEGTFANSLVTSADNALTVSHNYHASLTPFLYQVDVTITNTSGADFAGGTLYRRTMDWDIEPTPFNEYSTIQGTVGAANVLAADDNGFCNSNPLSGPCGGVPAPFTDLGPTDHGASFTFIFDPLAAGASRKLVIFYGVAPTERLALNALAAVGAEVYSFGQANIGGAPGDETFIFGFQGVGGRAVDGVPEPATWAMMIMGFGLAGGTLRRRRAQTVA
jgi:type IV pilus assembly protein PilY1